MRDCKGMSLVEAVIGMGVCAFMALAVTQMLTSHNQSVHGAELGMDFGKTAQTLQVVLGTNCTTALAGKTLNVGSLQAGQVSQYDLQSIALPGGTVAATGTTPAGLNITTLAIDKVLQANVGTDGTNTEHFVNFHLAAQTSTGRYQMDYPLLVWVSPGNQIVGCGMQVAVATPSPNPSSSSPPTYTPNCKQLCVDQGYAGGGGMFAGGACYAFKCSQIDGNFATVMGVKPECCCCVGGSGGSGPGKCVQVGTIYQCQ